MTEYIEKSDWYFPTIRSNQADQQIDQTPIVTMKDIAECLASKKLGEQWLKKTITAFSFACNGYRKMWYDGKIDEEQKTRLSHVSTVDSNACFNGMHFF